jgi:hypothetical protein
MNTMTLKQAQARIAELEAANKARRPKPTLKVSAKGGVSLYGLGRWPVTLYRESWETVLGMADQIRSFIDANASQLSTKNSQPV